MQISDFFFELPTALIAHYPQAVRSACRLLCLTGNSGAIRHGRFTDLVQQLQAGDLLVLNDTQVIPARLLGHKASGGQIEVLVERLLDDQQVLAHIRASHAPKPGSHLILGDDGSTAVQATVLARHDRLFRLQLHDPRPLLTILHAIGHIPLPPYIKRPDTENDRAAYQTLYARVPGAVAAPTAGLHFDQPLLTALQAKGVEIVYVTLHVGAGTFQPVQVEQIQEHVMHAEFAIVPDDVVKAVLACKARGNRVVAVGTTAVRALESAAVMARQGDQRTLIAPFHGETQLFIYPGYQYQIVDLLITNFHLPHSTLLMLVCAFAGQHNTLQAYQAAIAEGYRFFSYGDAMLITRKVDHQKTLD